MTGATVPAADRDLAKREENVQEKRIRLGHKRRELREYGFSTPRPSAKVTRKLQADVAALEEEVASQEKGLQEAGRYRDQLWRAEVARQEQAARDRNRLHGKSEQPLQTIRSRKADTPREQLRRREAEDAALAGVVDAEDAHATANRELSLCERQLKSDTIKRFEPLFRQEVEAAALHLKRFLARHDRVAACDAETGGYCSATLHAPLNVTDLEQWLDYARRAGLDV